MFLYKLILRILPHRCISFDSFEIKQATMKGIILLSVLAVAFARECGENQHYDSCGSACPITCENHENPPKFCVLMCNPGCHCDEGFVKTKDGRCVEPEECPAEENTISKCGVNQHYDSCGSACPITCENYENPPKFCVLMCKPGCHCDEGFVETKDGRCVEPEQCPAQAVCGENARFLECGSACPLTCDNYNNPPRACPAMCVTGCHCEKGFVKTRDGRCVRPENCPGSARATSELCSLPAEQGLCRGYFRRYYYNEKTGRCEKFVYGGCGGNENNFKTLEECHDNCGSS